MAASLGYAFFVVMFEPLHKLQLGISKLSKIYFMRYVGSAILCPEAGGSAR